MPRLLMLLGIFVITLSGCFGGDVEDVDNFLSRVKKEKGGKIEVIPEVKHYEAYTYKAEMLKSPFEPSTGFLAHKASLDWAVEETARPDADRGREILEEYPLDSLIMVGVVKRSSYVWGLVVDKKGIIHRVRIGNYLGENSGRINDITDNSIDLIETISDGQGGWVERSAKLRMKR